MEVQNQYRSTFSDPKHTANIITLVFKVFKGENNIPIGFLGKSARQKRLKSHFFAH